MKRINVVSANVNAKSASNTTDKIFAGAKSAKALAALAVFGIGAVSASSAMATAPANSFSVGILDHTASDTNCLSSSAPGLSATTSVCDAAGGNTQAAMVAYNSTGGWGSFVTLTGPSSVRMGVNGADQLDIDGTGIHAYNTMSMGSNKITGLAAGTVSTDAINLGQLTASAQSTANAFGGGASVNADGTIAPPSYTVHNADGSTTTVNDVGSALTNLDGRTAQNTTDISTINQQLSDGTVGLVQQDPTSRTITVGKSTDGTTVDMTGTAGSRTVTGVTAATLSSTSLDAVNGSQLYATNQNVAQNTSDISTLSTNVAKNTSDIATLNTNVAQNTSDISTLNTNVAKNTSDITTINQELSNGTVGLVQQDATTRTITVAKATDGTTVDMTGTAGTRTVTGVTAATLSATSTDAVNGSQLYTTNQNVTQNTADIATLNTNVAKNTSDIAQNTTDINTINQQLNSGSVGLVQQDAVTRVITVAKSTDGMIVDMTGTAGTRTVTGVTAGALSATSTDAVNGSQLYATNQNVAQNTADIATLNTNVAQNTSDIAKNTSDINTLNNNVAQNTSDIAKNTSDIATLNTNVSQNTTDIAKNTSDISTLNTNVAQNTSDINTINQQLNDGTVGLVKQDPTTRNITVAKDTDGTVVDMTGTQGARTVTGVAAGALTADSTDAVNGSQLYQTNQNVNTLSQQITNIAGSTSVIASQNTDTPAVASGTNSTALGNGSKATGNNSVALGSGSVADEDNTVSIGSVGNERRLSNVAPGVNGTDAANMNQLNAVQGNVNTVARQAFAGVAAAMAMPNLTPSQPGKTVVAASVANYKGYTAMGVGGTYRSRDAHWLVNAAASITPHGDTGVRGQVGYEF